MCLVVNLGEMLEIKVRIHLGRGYVRVPEQFLHAPQVMARFEDMGGERMPKQVGVDIGVDPLLFRPVLHAGLDRARTDAPASVTDKQGGLAGPRKAAAGCGPAAQRP